MYCDVYDGDEAKRIAELQSQLRGNRDISTTQRMSINGNIVGDLDISFLLVPRANEFVWFVLAATSIIQLAGALIVLTTHKE